jgi:hypothetical protein
MAYNGAVEMVAAVSNPEGSGVLTPLTPLTPDDLLP